MRAESLQHPDQSEAKMAEVGPEEEPWADSLVGLALREWGGASGESGRGKTRNGISTGHSQAGRRDYASKDWQAMVQWEGPL